MIETEGTQASGDLTSDFRSDVESRTPLGRIGRPEDIASVVVFLVSDEAAWITGEPLFVTCGFR